MHQAGSGHPSSVFSQLPRSRKNIVKLVVFEDIFWLHLHYNINELHLNRPKRERERERQEGEPDSLSYSSGNTKFENGKSLSYLTSI